MSTLAHNSTPNIQPEGKYHEPRNIPQHHK
jgi:hypothetical protein